ncbi:60S ribosomal protein L31-like [Mustela putorius furo]|uniref:Large ribosomal subunit protein eL31 n=1 Tax=Mustela putorius furo TaxID=9669 RepID=A0A8U0RLT2_MUSPF|nr:60S ribosomal protein L31-like [Mustela putorius furo]
MAPAKKCGEKRKGHSAMNDAVTREYATDIHECICGVGCKRRAPQAHREIEKFATKEMGTPDVRSDTRLSKAVWAKGIRIAPYCTRAQLSRKHNKGKVSSSKLHRLVTQVPFKSLRTVHIDED